MIVESMHKILGNFELPFSCWMILCCEKKYIVWCDLKLSNFCSCWIFLYFYCIQEITAKVDVMKFLPLEFNNIRPSYFFHHLELIFVYSISFSSSFICFPVTGFANVVYYRDRPFPLCKCWHLCQRSSNHICVGLFLRSP